MTTLEVLGTTEQPNVLEEIWLPPQTSLIVSLLVNVTMEFGQLSPLEYWILLTLFHVNTDTVVNFLTRPKIVF